MRELTVELRERSYPIYVGAGLLDDVALLGRTIGGRDVMVVTNATVAPLYLDRCLASLGDSRTAHVVLPDGEQHKTLDCMAKVITALLEQRLDRSCVLVALGGGVVGDITGFAAACYQRGVRYLQVPTTLLAQVDSSVGGKTAVNHALGKNMIGAFHQPVAVVIDTSVLATLPAREFAAGLAEVVKYGLIRDPVFFDWLEEHADALMARNPDTIAYAIERSCRNKAEVVAGDERESGARALLNLGHTFGHAIETALGYGVWLHGEAVAAGMVMAARLSARSSMLESGSVRRIEALLTRMTLPTRAPDSLSPDTLLEIMAVDKKARDRRIVLILLEAVGRAVVTADYDPELLRETLADCRSAPGCA